jgi:hypothetical protein
MLSTRRAPKVLFLALLLALALPPAVRAAAPASVTVRVEGANHTLLAPTGVTTGNAPVVKDGNNAHSCPGATAAGALELATGGSWGGEWFESLHGYSVETILGERLAFEFGAPENFFWSYWLDNKPSSVGICEGELSSGESILFFPECFSEEEPSPCPPSPNPLGIEAPAVAEAGKPFTVVVTSYANASGAPSPAAGAIVAGGGAQATTDATGHATLTLTGTGSQQLQATAPSSVRSEISVCVHAGNDGLCGAATSGGASGGASTPAATSYKGAYAVVAHADAVSEGHVYSRKSAPRLLRGTISTHAPIASVSIELRRSYRGRCSAYDGLKERFKRTRCGGGSFFSVGDTPNFSYLLPAALAPGRYVLDIEATDTLGNHTTLARGSTRTVFFVR